VSDGACAHATSATYVREPVDPSLREMRSPSFGSIQITQDSVKIRLHHERRRRVKTRAKRLVYCILST
jgi:hypothetical protein